MLDVVAYKKRIIVPAPKLRLVKILVERTQSPLLANEKTGANPLVE